MTYKHVKFEDSSTMRSLTKLAQDKGWIKEEPVVKTASPVLDLQPSDNLLENLLKLCQGLRTSGFEKQAEELESKFVIYKQAQTNLYNVGGEEGEDLVHAAHPKGSHKLENVDSTEATFEDILDQHMKGVEVATKAPHGKLASSEDIVNAVKVALGAPFLVLAQYSAHDLYARTLSYLEGFRKIKSIILTKLDDPDEASISDRWLADIEGKLKSKDIYGERDFENALIKALNSLHGEEEPGFFSTERTKRTWQDEVVPLFVELKKYADNFYD